MPISAPPTIPQITDPSTFATRAQAWVVWQANELYPAIEDSATVLTLSTSSTSTTSNTIGTGSKSFTVETGKGYLAGQSLSIAYTTTPTNRMFAVVTSYNSGTGALVVNVQAIEGSGTFTDWAIALAFNGVITNAQVPNNELTLNKLARVGTAGQFLTSGGAGADPSYTTLASSTKEQSEAGTDNATFLTPLRLRNGLNATGTAPIYACRAWVNFNGTGTVAIRASGNVSSITDNGVGNYTVNFTTEMPDTNYALSGFCRGSSAAADANSVIAYPADSKTTSAMVIRTTFSNAGGNGLLDFPEINVQFFR
jgi:hypothetical protein